MITTLTEKQKARFPEFVKKWTSIGLSTQPANRTEAERGIRMVYETAGLKHPKIIWCGSPLSQGLTRALLLGLKDAEIKTGESVWESVWESVGASVWESVRASVRASVGASVGASVYGQHDANWLGFYDYFKEVCELGEVTQKLTGMWLVAQHAGWFLPHEHICWVSERHNRLLRDDQGRLHCEDGPALTYPDGFSIFAIHGVRLPAYVIMEPQKVTLADIDGEQNSEIKRVKLDRFGWAKYLLESKAEEIHRDDFGILYRKEITGDEPLIMVKVVNATPEPDGSFKDYILRVPPAMTTAHQAVAWTFGKTVEDYMPLVET